jgi:hypothetical protein
MLSVQWYSITGVINIPKYVRMFTTIILRTFEAYSSKRSMVEVACAVSRILVFPVIVMFEGLSAEQLKRAKKCIEMESEYF